MPTDLVHLDVPASRWVEAPALLIRGWASLRGTADEVQVRVDGRPEATRQLIRLDVERAQPKLRNVVGFEAFFDPAAATAAARFPPGKPVDIEVSVCAGGLEVLATTIRYRRTLCPEGRVGFFLIGASRSASTSLHEFLQSSPEICMSRPKEPGYFRAEHRRGAGFYWRRYFAHHAGERLAGDACPDHLSLPWVAARIHDYNPKARLLVCLRHPYARTCSHWRQLAQHPEFGVPFATFFSESAAQGLEPQGPEAVEAGFRDPVRLRRDPDFWRTSALATSGRYAERLAAYFALFPRSRIHVMIFEELVADRQRALAGLLAFLGADPARCPRLELPLRNASAPRAAHAAPDRAGRAALRAYYEPLHGELEDLLGRAVPWSY
jgi:hypothetical protein